jgi:RNA polymerase sigma-70 factor (ECF subfamily)
LTNDQAIRRAAMAVARICRREDLVIDPVMQLLDRWRGGDHQAAGELFRLHAGRLIGLARSRLSAKLAVRIDAEDVVQSAYRSFFARAREGGFELHQGEDLWALLVAITLNKVHEQIRRNNAGKRTIAVEQSLEGDANSTTHPSQLQASDPSPLEAVAIVDQVEEVMRRLDPLRRRMLELRLQGYTLEEIAAETSLSRRTIRRFLTRVKEDLEHWAE